MAARKLPRTDSRQE